MCYKKSNKEFQIITESQKNIQTWKNVEKAKEIVKNISSNASVKKSDKA